MAFKPTTFRDFVVLTVACLRILMFWNTKPCLRVSGSRRLEGLVDLLTLEGTASFGNIGNPYLQDTTSHPKIPNSTSLKLFFLC
jgi:hypothetical protein